MDLQTSIYRETQNPDLDTIVPLCELAKELEDAGEFELAEETLRPVWKGIPNRPNTSGLKVQEQAELLLRAGTLTGWLGSAKQLSGSQEVAKDLISESATIFETVGLSEK